MKKFLLMHLFILFCFFSVSFGFSQEKEPIVNYQILFSPEDHIAEELIALIKKEQTSIKSAIYCLLHRDILKALIEAHKRGVKVEIIIDSYSMKSRFASKKMQEANIPVFVWNPTLPIVKVKNDRKIKKSRSLMHDKFCIFGNNRVWTGSFNFTFAGSNANRENVIILENKEIASRYLEEFERLKKEGCSSINEYLLQKESVK